jgi:hypothetical protein
MGNNILDSAVRPKLMSMLSMMNKAEQVQRVKNGVYELPVPRQKDEG